MMTGVLVAVGFVAQLAAGTVPPRGEAPAGATAAASSRPPTRSVQQTLPQLDVSRFDSLTLLTLRAQLDLAIENGLPTAPLINRALEGAARRASGAKILQVVRDHMAAMAHARVPATLLRLDKTHQAAVVEVGTNHPGELAPLLKLIAPQFGVITNVGREHLEFFGDLDGVAKEEGALAELLPADGKLFLNGDNEWSDAIAKRAKATVVRVGSAANCDWRVKNVKLDKNGAAFSVETAREEFCGTYRIGLLGRHQVGNSMFAIALGAELGLSRDEIKAGLAECVPAKMRLEIYEASGVRVLDDAYNANADSMLAALLVLQELPCKGRRVAVLGDMAELGAHSESAHAEVGRLAAELGVEQLIAVGKMAGTMAQAAREAGLSRVIELENAESAASSIKSFLKAGDTVLLKASRSSRLERIANALKAGDVGKRN